jgi:hypothetical protein
MTTQKPRLTIYLSAGGLRDLDDLVEALRRLAPLEARGAISRSTAIEAAVRLALADLKAHGRTAAIFATLVTSPAPQDDPTGEVIP